MDTISIIAALGMNREIGFRNELIWEIPEDKKRFRALTTGHPVIMGRITWESLPPIFRPLPKRTNVVLSRNASYEAPGAIVCQNLEDALLDTLESPGSAETFIIGGAALYAEALPRAQKLYLTMIEDEKAADAYFPEYDESLWETVNLETRQDGDLRYHFVDLVRK